MAAGSAPRETNIAKSKTLNRLGAAGVLAVVVLAGLWWLNRADEGKPANSADTPDPIISAPAPMAAPAPLPPDMPSAMPERPSEPPPQAGQVAPPIAPTPKPAAQAASPRTSTSAEAEPARPVLARAEPPAGRGYVVQLGVFTQPGNAQMLVDRLNALGIRTYTETRVHVGPLLSRAEAEKARNELRRHGINGVVGATK